MKYHDKADKTRCLQHLGFRCVQSTSDENPVERNRQTCTLFIVGIAMEIVVFCNERFCVRWGVRPLTILLEFVSLSPARTFVKHSPNAKPLPRNAVI
jgi:hypothetical protein